MYIQSKLQNVDAIEASITITMSIEDWKRLRKQLAEAHPSWKIGSAITFLSLKVDEMLREEITQL